MIAERKYNPLLCRHPNIPLNLPLIEGSGDTIYDISENKETGDITDGTWVSSSIGYYLSANGTSTKVEFGDKDQFNIESGAIESLFRTSETQDLYGGRILEIGTSTDRVGLHIWSDGKIRLFIRQNNVAVLNKAGSVVTDGDWHHVIATWGEDGAIIYLNNTIDVEAGGDQRTDFPTPTLNLCVDYGGTNYFYKGDLRFARLHNLYLSNETVTSLFLDIRRRLRI